MTSTDSGAARDGGEAVNGRTGNTALSFDVRGQLAAQGSKRHVGHGVMVESSKKLKPWREAVKTAALDALGGRPGFPKGVPVEVRVTFRFQRPNSHYRTGRNADLLRGDVPEWVTKKPDLDKLLRAVLDPLTDVGVVHDDAQVVAVSGCKLFVSRDSWGGAHVSVCEVPS